jgi:hypothetical protein
MVSFWTENEAVQGLDNRRKCAELDLINSNLVEREFDAVVIDVESLKVANSPF